MNSRSRMRSLCRRNLYIRGGFSIRHGWELVLEGGVQRREDARNLTSLRARRRSLAETGRDRRRKFSRVGSQHFPWRCVTSLDPKSVPRQNLGSLQGCLVEGDPEQRARERRVRRKALVTSVFVQAGLLAAVILVPLFAKPAHLERPIVTPIPPYRHVAARAENM